MLAGLAGVKDGRLVSGRRAGEKCGMGRRSWDTKKVCNGVCVESTVSVGSEHAFITDFPPHLLPTFVACLDVAIPLV